MSYGFLRLISACFLVRRRGGSLLRLDAQLLPRQKLRLVDLRQLVQRFQPEHAQEIRRRPIQDSRPGTFSRPASQISFLVSSALTE